jgi:sugar diacid utilization regulator
MKGQGTVGGDRIDTLKQKQVRDKIIAHLRKTARRMVQFDTLDETLRYLIDSFRKQFSCDYMAIITVEKLLLMTKASDGNTRGFAQRFPLSLDDCLPQILTEPLCSSDAIDGKQDCAVLSCLDDEQFQTWFTIPIRQEDGGSLGLCVIGFRSFVPLLADADKLFEEYGKDIATAFSLATQKENENKKIKGLEWLKDNVLLGGSSLEQITEKIVERAGKGTNAKSAYIYLYDDQANRLLLQPQIYGDALQPSQIDLRELFDLTPYFAYLEKPGGVEITVPLLVNLKMIGVLHVREKEQSPSFTDEDLELLQFLASHVSAVVENARLYRSERDRKDRLETFMSQQQELVKHTLEDDGFGSICEYLSGMLDGSVFLFDRFFHLNASYVSDPDRRLEQAVLAAAANDKRTVMKSSRIEHWTILEDQRELGLWRVMGGGDTLGYLGLVIPENRLDLVLRMTLNHALNVYAIQFIKQKLALEAREQAKDSFFNQLFAVTIRDKGKIVEYANLLNWNINEPHRIGLFAFLFDKTGGRNSNVLEEDADKTWIWERIRDHVSRLEPGIVLTRKDGHYMAIVPQEKGSEQFWKSFYERIDKMINAEGAKVSIYIGISQEAGQMEDYHLCYKQAQKTLAILCNRFPKQGYMSFDQLGAYTVLYHLGDPHAAPLFLKTYLDPLLQHGNGKNRDLFDTLRTYLQTNGSIKDASNLLFIHRSSLKYRLEKIREILRMDIDNAEQRFNLLLAYKLHDLISGETLDVPE